MSEFKNISDDVETSIKSSLEHYRFVNSVTVEDHKVSVKFDSKGTMYDSDAVIGMLARKFDLDYTGEKHGTLHFVNWQQ